MPPLQNSQDNDCDMHWLQYLKGQAEAQSNTGGHVRLVEVSGQRPLCGISQLHVRHLKWHADCQKPWGLTANHLSQTSTYSRMNAMPLV